MKIYPLAAVIFIVVLAMSCKSDSNNTDNREVAIELNNGQKWKVNTKMTPFILQAEQILIQYNGNDYDQLAEQLDEKNKGLIKNCTMEGKGHDELHKWLQPHMQLIEALDDAKTSEEAMNIIAELKNSIKTYHIHFQ